MDRTDAPGYLIRQPTDTLEFALVYPGRFNWTNHVRYLPDQGKTFWTDMALYQFLRTFF